jgi:hypothetical protein
LTITEIADKFNLCVIAHCHSAGHWWLWYWQRAIFSFVTGLTVLTQHGYMLTPLDGTS